MDAMIHVLEEVIRLYADPRAAGQTGSSDTGYPAATQIPGMAAADSCLDGPLEAADRRLADLAAWWRKRRNGLAPAEQERVRALAREARRRLLAIMDRCEAQSAALQADKARILESLGRLQQGARFLRSERPGNTNYPKFIDAHG